MTVRILVGDALAHLRTLPAESVQVVVTSPPYFGLRDYGVEGQIGLERSPSGFIEHLMLIFDEVKRVLRKDGLCFVNLGDSYSGSGKGGNVGRESILGNIDMTKRQGFNGSLTRAGGIPAKNLLLIPERFSIAMQDSGWTVRSRIAWCKTSAMPESAVDRPTSAWEHIYMFSKAGRYFYDADAVRQPLMSPDNRHNPNSRHGVSRSEYDGIRPGGPLTRERIPMRTREWNPLGASLRNFWLLGPSPLKEAHFAAFPPEIPKRAILAGTSQKGACPACGAGWRRVAERTLVPTPKSKNGTATVSAKRGANRDPNDHRETWGEVHGSYSVKTLDWRPSCSCDAGPPIPQTVLDPFLGSGTTALVADRLDRDAIGIELSEEYAEMARRRIESDAGALFGETVEVEAPQQGDMFDAGAVFDEMEAAMIRRRICSVGNRSSS